MIDDTDTFRKLDMNRSPAEVIKILTEIKEYTQKQIVYNKEELELRYTIVKFIESKINSIKSY